MSLVLKYLPQVGSQGAILIFIIMPQYRDFPRTLETKLVKICSSPESQLKLPGIQCSRELCPISKQDSEKQKSNTMLETCWDRDVWDALCLLACSWLPFHSQSCTTVIFVFLKHSTQTLHPVRSLQSKDLLEKMVLLEALVCCVFIVFPDSKLTLQNKCFLVC